MATAASRIGFRVARGQAYAGLGYLAGSPPSGTDDVDGRYRIQNVPSRGRVTVYERSTMTCVASTLAAADGTWRIDGLDPRLVLTVIGWDDTRNHNAAIQDWVQPAVD